MSPRHLPDPTGRPISTATADTQAEAISSANAAFIACYEAWLRDTPAATMFINPDLLYSVAGYFYHSGGRDAIAELREERKSSNA